MPRYYHFNNNFGAFAPERCLRMKPESPVQIPGIAYHFFKSACFPIHLFPGDILLGISGKIQIGT
jgi:hypothetical protein